MRVTSQSVLSNPRSPGPNTDQRGPPDIAASLTTQGVRRPKPRSNLAGDPSHKWRGRSSQNRAPSYRKKPVVVSQLPWKPSSTKTQPVPDPAGGRGSMPQVRSLKKILVKRTPWRHCHSHAEMAWTIYVSGWYWQSRFYAPSTSGSRRPPRRMDALRAPQRLVRPPEGADQP